MNFVATAGEVGAGEDCEDDGMDAMEHDESNSQEEVPPLIDSDSNDEVPALIDYASSIPASSEFLSDDEDLPPAVFTLQELNELSGIFSPHANAHAHSWWQLCPANRGIA